MVKVHGTVWFTDPPFGFDGFYEGHKATAELPQNVYCLEPKSRKLKVVLNDVKRPSGLCFSADEKTLYSESLGVPNKLILAWDL